jgi:O-antigen ligase
VAFFLFLLVTLTLFLRPSELVPGLATVPIYNYLILATLAVGAPRVIEHLRPGNLVREPVTACVVGLVPAVVLSHLIRMDTYPARVYTWEFSKVVIYYLLLICMVDSLQRLRILLYSIALFTTVLSAIAVLHYFEYIDVPSLSVLQEHGEIDPTTGALTSIPRLRATGIFNDPNDLSMIAVLAIVICTMGLFDARFGLVRMAWLAPMGLLVATLALTKSRGGLLAGFTAAATLAYFRFGFWKTAAAACLFLPVLAAMGGRQSDLGSGFSGGTGEARVELWSAGLIAIRRSPLFGIGYDRYADEAGQVAHNSFVHCFVELGLYGGALFLGAFWFSGLSLWELGREIRTPLGTFAKGAFCRLQPYLLSIIVGSAVSQMSLSRCYVVPTYLVFGVANAYCLESRRQGLPGTVSLTPRRVGELVLLSIGFLAGIYLFIRLGFR